MEEKNDDGDNGDEKISQFSIYDQNLLTIRSHGTMNFNNNNNVDNSKFFLIEQ